MFRRGIVLLLFIKFSKLVICLAQIKNKAPTSSVPIVCGTSACLDLASNLLQNIDQRVNPCDNFYKYACGNYVKIKNIPDDRQSYTHRFDVKNEIRRNLENSLREKILSDDPKAFKLLKTSYNTCMSQGLVYQNQFLDIMNNNYGGWPVLLGSAWDESRFHAINSLYFLRKLGYESNYFFNFTTTNNPSKARRYILQITPPLLGITKDALLQGMKSKETQEYYTRLNEIVKQMANNHVFNVQDINSIISFELGLAEIMSKDTSQKPVIMSLPQLKKFIPTIPWEDFIKKMLFENINIERVGLIKLVDPSQVQNVAALLSRTPKRTLANYISWRFSKDVRDQNEVNGNSSFLNNRCWKNLLDKLPVAMNIFYIKKYVNENKMRQVLRMIDQVKLSFEQLIMNAQWVDGETKNSILTRLRSMAPRISFLSEYYRDTKLLDNYYNDLYNKIYGNNKVGYNVDGILLAHSMSKAYSNYPDDTEQILTMDVDLVNAVYNYGTNTIKLTPGVMEGIYFNTEVPRYMNYGGLGFLVGHELTHGFHDLMRIFGNETRLYGPREATRKNFLSRSDCIQSQYHTYTVEQTNIKTNGTSTLHENIADNGGLKAAYWAYDALEKKYPGRQEPPLRGFENLRPKQMFWLSYAHSFCAKYRPEILEQFVATEIHSLNEIRVIGTLQNRPEFAEDFKCPIGSRMNPRTKCNLWRRRRRR